MVVVSAFWGREVSNGHHPSDGTHVEDLKNLVQVHPPSGNSLFFFLCVETPRDTISFNPPDELLLNMCYDPAVESIISGGLKSCHWLNSRRELVYCIIHGLTELV